MSFIPDSMKNYDRLGDCKVCGKNRWVDYKKHMCEECRTK